MRVLGLINARGGSKGVPRKNLKPLHGRPLIAYTIEAGLHAKRIDRLVVSTDDEEIAEVSRSCGAEVPFMRPDSLAQDSSVQIDAVKHALLALEEADDHFDVVAVLQPTCPLRRAEDIDAAITLMDDDNVDSVITVTNDASRHPYVMYWERQDGTLEAMVKADAAGTLRQDFPVVWCRNGAVYAVRTQIVLERNSLYGDCVMGSPMPVERSANIDSPLDWVVTEAFMAYLNVHEG